MVPLVTRSPSRVSYPTQLLALRICGQGEEEMATLRPGKNIPSDFA